MKYSAPFSFKEPYLALQSLLVRSYIKEHIPVDGIELYDYEQILCRFIETVITEMLRSDAYLKNYPIQPLELSTMAAEVRKNYFVEKERLEIMSVVPEVDSCSEVQKV